MTTTQHGAELLAVIRSGDYARIADTHRQFEASQAADAAAGREVNDGR